MNPPLRFSTTEDWTECQLKDICEINPSVEKIPDTFQYIDLESVTNGRLLQTIPCCKSSAPSRAKRILSNEDVLFQTVRPYQKNNYFFKSDSNTSVVASTGYAQLRCTSNSAYFLYTLIHTDSFVNQVLQKCTGGAYPAITASSLSTVKINIPVVQEQQKIASFFSTLDQKIELNERKLEALEKLKKGVMQKCFNNSNWTKHQLKDVCKSFSGGTPNSKNRSFYNGEIPFIRSGEIHQNITELSVTTEAVKNSSAKLVKSGDLLYALYGANSGDCDLSKINGAINQAILCIRPKSDNIVDMLFLKEQLFHLKSKITSKYLQGGQGNLSGRLVMNLSILLPPYIEQLTYSSLFGSINNKIEITKQKLFLLQKLKQGLMQQMFI